MGINNIHCKTGNVQILKLLLEELLIWDKTIKSAQITYESKSHFQKEVRSRALERCRCLTNRNNLNTNVAAPDYILDLQPSSCPIRAARSCFHQWHSLSLYTPIGPHQSFWSSFFLSEQVSLFDISPFSHGWLVWEPLRVSKPHNVLHCPPNQHGSELVRNW